jgi:two-component system NarL family sensor kinase
MSESGTNDLRLVRAVAEALAEEPDVRRALERTLALVAERLGLQTGWVWLRDEGSDQFFSGASHHLPPFLQEPVRMTGASCWCLDSFRAGKLTPGNIPVLQCSRLREAVSAGDIAATEGLRSHASVPLIFRGRPLGILNIAGPEWRRLTDDELNLLSAIAYQVAGAVERARLAEEEARLVRAEERARFAREIHDTLAQDLTGIGLQIESALANLERDPKKARLRLDNALALTRTSLEEARRSVLALRAAPLDNQNLPDALRTLGRRFSSETGISVTITADGLPDSLPARLENELYRIVQEALSNVRRHARHATEVTIRLSASAARLTLSIGDNGHGGDAVSSGMGQGIPGMRERVRVLGGSLRLTLPRLNRGMTVTASVPLPGAEVAE